MDDEAAYFGNLDAAITQRDFMRALRLRKDWMDLADQQGTTVSMRAVQRGWSAWSALLLAEERAAPWSERDAQGRTLWFYALAAPDALADPARSNKLLSRLQKGAENPIDARGRGLFVQWLTAKPGDLRTTPQSWGGHPERWLRVVGNNPDVLFGGKPDDTREAAGRLIGLIRGDEPELGLTDPQQTSLLDTVVGGLAVAALRTTPEGLVAQAETWDPLWRAALALAVWFVQRGAAGPRPPESMERDPWLTTLSQSLPPPHRTPAMALLVVRSAWLKDVRALPESLRADLVARATQALSRVPPDWLGWPLHARAE